MTEEEKKYLVDVLNKAFAYNGIKIINNLEKENEELKKQLEDLTKAYTLTVDKSVVKEQEFEKENEALKQSVSEAEEIIAELKARIVRTGDEKMTDEEKRHIDNLKQVLERVKNYSALSVIEKLEEENKELSQRIKELEFDVWEQKQFADIYKSNYEKIRGARKNVEKLLDELKEEGIIKDWVYNQGYNLEIK